MKQLINPAVLLAAFSFLSCDKAMDTELVSGSRNQSLESTVSTAVVSTGPAGALASYRYRTDPFGGTGGTEFSINPPDDHSRIVEFGVNHNGSAILGIQIKYQQLNGITIYATRGNTTGIVPKTFSSDEYIKGITIRYTSSKVIGLTFKTSKTTYRFGATTGGTEKNIDVASGFLVLGFFGRSSTDIDQMGFEIHCKFWRQMPGYAGVDVAVDVNGDTYLTSQDGGIYKFSSTYYKWERMSGSGGVRIAANAYRQYLVNSNGIVYEKGGADWRALPMSNLKAKDVAVGSDASIWMVATNGSVYQYNGSSWTIKSNRTDGHRIAAGGKAWLITNDRRVWFYDNDINNWVATSFGSAADIAVSNDTLVWYTDTDGNIFRVEDLKKQQICGYDGLAIAANNSQVLLVNPVVLGSGGHIHRLTY